MKEGKRKAIVDAEHMKREGCREAATPQCEQQWVESGTAEQRNRATRWESQTAGSGSWRPESQDCIHPILYQYHPVT